MDCRQFNNLLWEKPGQYISKDTLPQAMKDHLDACPDCRQAYLDFLELSALSDTSMLQKDDTYWQGFETKVWQKIENTEQAVGKTAKETFGFQSRQVISFKHLIASLGVAAFTITFIMLAVSNINQESDVAKMILKAEKGIHSEMQAAPEEQTQMKKYSVRMNRAPDGSLEIKEFSLLPKPEVNVIDTSAIVSIDEAYLTDEGLQQENISIAKALSKKVVVNKGVIDTSIPKMEAYVEMRPDSDWVITVEKMPKMIKAVPPNYPALAYRLKRGGEVWIKAHVDASGKVIGALIHESSGGNYGFEEAALAAAYKNQFEPFEVNGVGIPIWVIYKVRFVTKD